MNIVYITVRPTCPLTHEDRVNELRKMGGDAGGKYDIVGVVDREQEQGPGYGCSLLRANRRVI
jgi:hypothetical protein